MSPSKEWRRPGRATGQIRCDRALLQVFPIDGRILQNPLRYLEVRRVLEGNRMRRIVVERENLGAWKRQ